MTMVYVAVIQNDPQRQYHRARQALSQVDRMPELLASQPAGTPTNASIPAVLQSLAAARHLLEMFRHQLKNEKARRKLQRLANRLAKVDTELDQLATDLEPLE